MVPPRTRRVGRRSGGVLLRVLFWGTIAATVLVLVVPKLLHRSSEPAAAAGEPGQIVESTEAADQNKIEPGPYQDQITALEQRLYREPPGGLDDADHVSHLAMTLSMAVRGDGRDPRRLRAFGKLFDYAGAVGAQADVGYTTANLVDLRTRWEQTRDAVFGDAPWFSRSTETPAAEQTPVTPTATHFLQSARDYLAKLDS